MRHDPAEMLELQLHLLGDLRFRRMPAELRFKSGSRVGDLAASPAHVARAPVGFAEAIKNRTAYAKFGEGFELHILRAVETAGGFEQSYDTGADEIFHFHMLRQPLANAGSNVIHLRQFLHDEIVALGRTDRARLVCQFRWRHWVTSFTVLK